VVTEVGERLAVIKQYQINISNRFTALFTYLHTPWSRVLEKPTGSKLVKKFPAIYGT